MKKFLLFLFSFLLFLAIFIGFLFTPIGNSIIKSIVESEVNKNSPVKISFSKFRVGFNSFEIKTDFLNSTALIEGNYSIFSQNFNADYKIYLLLSDLKNFINYSLNGDLNTWGSISGNLKKIKINGKSDFSKSNTRYFVDIENKKLSKIVGNIKNLDLETLLYVLNQPQLLKGKFNSDIVLNSIEKDNLDGKIKAYVKDGIINRELIKKDYNITLPKTVFNLNSDILLNGKKIAFLGSLISNIFKAKVKGDFEESYLNAGYKVNFDNLALLTPIINQKIRGKFRTFGTVKGKSDNLVVNGKAYLADGKIDYKSELGKKELSYTLKNLKIEKLLYMFYQPRYSYGDINSEGNISFNKEINGKIEANVKGITDKNVLHKEFNFTDAKISYNLNTDINIKNSLAFIKTSFNSDVANVFLPDGKFDINKSVFTSKYKITFPDLNRLYFATHKHLKGKLSVNGNIKKDKNLLITGKSKTLGGEIDYKLLNNDLVLDGKSLYVLKLMEMLEYPKVFDSTANLNLKYNLLNKKGVLNASLTEGRFVPNRLTYLIKTLTHFDLTKEIYKNATLHSFINDKKILSDLDMKSRLTRITSKKAFIDLQKEYIKAKLRVEIVKKPVYVKLEGNLTSPKIKIDAKEFLKSEIKNTIKKEIKKRKLKEKLKKELQKRLPSNIFKLF